MLQDFASWTHCCPGHDAGPLTSTAWQHSMHRLALRQHCSIWPEGTLPAVQRFLQGLSDALTLIPGVPSALVEGAQSL